MANLVFALLAKDTQNKVDVLCVLSQIVHHAKIRLNSHASNVQQTSH